jgi:hypothetical protein
MKKILLSLLIANFLLVGLAKTASAQNQENIGLLPTNPFYFVKNWFSRLEIILTPNSLKKAEKEILFAEEKLQEARIVAQSAPENINAIKKALRNYQSTQERLVKRLEKLPSVSQNPNVEKIIEAVIRKNLEHESLFKNLEDKFTAPDKIPARIFEEIKSKKDEVLAGTFAKDGPATVGRMSERLEDIQAEIVAMQLTGEGAPIPITMPPIKPAIAEILKRLEDKAPDIQLKEKIRSEFDKTIEDIKLGTEKSAEEAKIILKEINKLDIDKQAVILNELEKRIEKKEVKLLVESAQSQTAESVKKIPQDIVREKAKSLIDIVKNLIERVNEKLNVLNQIGQKIPADFAALFENAKKHFDNGLAAYDSQDFGQSFGQLNSAYRILSSLIDKLNILYPEKEDLLKILTDLENELRRWRDKISNLAEEDPNKTEADKILNEISQLLSQAKSEIETDKIDAARFLLDQIKKLFVKLRGLFAAVVKPISPIAALPGKHYKCYDIKVSEEKTRLPIEVTLKDQFGQEFVKVIKPSELCAPVIKRHISSPPPQPPRSPCEIPAELIERLNKCAGDECAAIKEKIESIKKACSKIQLQSQLLNQVKPVETETIKDESAESIKVPPLADETKKILEDSHLKCYEFEEISGPTEYPNVRVTDQFGTEVLKIIKPKKLCNPATKTIAKREVVGVPALPTEPELKIKPHYKCYEIIRSSDQTIEPLAVVQAGPLTSVINIPSAVFLSDQFIKRKTAVLEPELLCTPVIKVHGKHKEIKQPVKSAFAPYDHLKCYKIREEKIGDLPIVKVADQFGIEILRPKEAKYLCNPAQKIVIPPPVPPYRPPIEPPSEPPSKPPSEPPSKPPSEPPSKPPSEPPSKPPTKPPVRPPSKKPIEILKPEILKPTEPSIAPVAPPAPPPTIKPESITPLPSEPPIRLIEPPQTQTISPTDFLVTSFFDVFIEIDLNGHFSPSNIQVKKGAKVTWTNNSEKSVWPASDIHPTHQLYPGFDALRGLKPGETYSFTFEKVGIWPYHDHLNPLSAGKIEVIE